MTLSYALEVDSDKLKLSARAGACRRTQDTGAWVRKAN